MKCDSVQVDREITAFWRNLLTLSSASHVLCDKFPDSIVIWCWSKGFYLEVNRKYMSLMKARL